MDSRRYENVLAVQPRHAVTISLTAGVLAVLVFARFGSNGHFVRGLVALWITGMLVAAAIAADVYQRNRPTRTES
jgi:hypothetical protein